MPYEVRIEKTQRTIVVKGTGNSTTADTIKMIADQREAFRENLGFNLLYDSSEMQIDSSSADMLKVTTALFEESGMVFGRIAVVVPESRAGLARMFTALAHPHGINANVFTDVRDARKWLGITNVAD